jgi:predicted NUDIX family NTP pyrophosphohydrolase
LLRNNNGSVTDWLGQTNGTFFSNHVNASYVLPAGWHVEGAGDFNGDGRDDVLLRNDNGTITEWLGQPNGSFFSNHAIVAYGLDTSWHVDAIGDFNGDGRGDLLLRNNNGSVTNWLGQIDGSFFSNHANASYALPAGWHVEGTGDFNGDSRDDLLLRHDNGTITEWLGQSNGSFFSNHAVAAYALDTSWHVDAIGDFNGDGRDDVLLRNDNGSVTDWLGASNGSFFSNHVNASYVIPAGWHVQSDDLWL